MKIIHKRVLIVVVTLLVAIAVQWLSGVPFQRSPEEATFAVFALLFAMLFGTYPFDEEHA